MKVRIIVAGLGEIKAPILTRNDVNCCVKTRADDIENISDHRMSLMIRKRRSLPSNIEYPPYIQYETISIYSACEELVTNRHGVSPGLLHQPHHARVYGPANRFHQF